MEAFLKAESRKIHVLYAHNDDMAIGAIQAIEEAGIKPGQEILIVSIDAREGRVRGHDRRQAQRHHRVQSLVRAAAHDLRHRGRGRAHRSPKRIVVEEQVFTMETAKQHIQSRKY